MPGHSLYLMRQVPVVMDRPVTRQTLPVTQVLATTVAELVMHHLMEEVRETDTSPEVAEVGDNNPSLAGHSGKMQMLSKGVLVVAALETAAILISQSHGNQDRLSLEICLLNMAMLYKIASR